MKQKLILVSMVDVGDALLALKAKQRLATVG
jgi:hypothetical protein